MLTPILVMALSPIACDCVIVHRQSHHCDCRRSPSPVSWVPRQPRAWLSQLLAFLVADACRVCASCVGSACWNSRHVEARENVCVCVWFWVRHRAIMMLCSGPVYEPQTGSSLASFVFPSVFHLLSLNKLNATSTTRHVFCATTAENPSRHHAEGKEWKGKERTENSRPLSPHRFFVVVVVVAVPIVVAEFAFVLVVNGTALSSSLSLHHSSIHSVIFSNNRPQFPFEPIWTKDRTHPVGRLCPFILSFIHLSVHSSVPSSVCV